MAVTSRVYAGTGGLIKANFDDIRLYNRDYGLGDVLAILGSSAGVDQQSVKDIDDFTDDSYVGVADTISILRYIAGLRNWR